MLYSDTDNEGSDSSVGMVRIEDKGSKPRKVTVTIQGIPAQGVIDSGADITIINADLFKNIAAAAKLRKKAFKQPDKVPYTYDQKPFTLDGRVDLDISFNGCTMCTPVYVKMDAKDQLLLSEGVCNQLRIITYHSAVSDTQHDVPDQLSPSVTVPCVRVKLLHTVRIPPLQSTNVTVQFERDSVPPQSMIEPLECGVDAGLYVGNSLVQTTFDDKAQVVITNLSPLTQKISKGCFIGQCNEVSVVQYEELSNVQTEETAIADVMSVTTLDTDTRKEKLATLLANEGSTLKPQEKECLLCLLQEFHQAFVLDDGERGETDLISMELIQVTLSLNANLLVEPLSLLEKKFHDSYH